MPEIYQTDGGAGTGIWTANTVNSTPLGASDLTPDLEPPYEQITTMVDLLSYLTELIVRFDSAPENYKKDDYNFLLKTINRCVLHIYTYFPDLVSLLGNVSDPESLTFSEKVTFLKDILVNEKIVTEQYVEATQGFKKVGSSNSDVLLGGGGTKSLQSIYDESAGVVAIYAQATQDAKNAAEEAQAAAELALNTLNNTIDDAVDNAVEESTQIAVTAANTATGAAEESQTILEAVENLADNIGLGGPKGTYANLAALIADDPDNSYIYITSDDGHWNYWNGNAWTDGGLWQSPLDVVQVTGTSETDVMSQKGVTDAITQPISNISTSIELSSFLKEIQGLDPTKNYYIKDIARNYISIYFPIKIYIIRVYEYTTDINNATEIAWLFTSDAPYVEDPLVQLYIPNTTIPKLKMIVDWNAIADGGRWNTEKYIIKSSYSSEKLSPYIYAKTELDTTKYNLSRESEMSTFDRINLVDGKWYGNNSNVITYETSVNTTCQKFHVQKGDVVYLKTQGRNLAIPYLIGGSNNQVIFESPQDNTLKEYEIEITDADSHFLFVNCDINQKSNFRILFKERKDIKDVADDLLETNTEVSEIKGEIGIESYTVVSDSYYDNNNGVIRFNQQTIGEGTIVNVVLDVQQGDKVLLKTKGRNLGHAYFICDSSGNVLSGSGQNNDYKEYFIPIDSATATKLYINMDKAYHVANPTHLFIKRQLLADFYKSRKTPVVFWGASSIEGYLGNGVNIPDTVRNEIIDSSLYEVHNTGIGGETIQTILGKMGAIPFYIQNSFVLPANMSEVVIADGGTTQLDAARVPFLSMHNDGAHLIPSGKFKGTYTNYAALVAANPDTQYVYATIDEGKWYQYTGGSWVSGGSYYIVSPETHWPASNTQHINPVYVNGVECTLKVYTKSNPNNEYQKTAVGRYWTLKRNTTGAYDMTMPAKSIVVTSAAKKFRNSINIFLCGMNGTWTTFEEWLSLQNKGVDFSNGKFVVMGFQVGTESGQASHEKIQRDAYGINFFNTRHMVAKYGLFDFAEELDLPINYLSGDDTSIVPSHLTSRLTLVTAPTPSDIQYINQGRIPQTLMADENSHFNEYGYYVAGQYVYRKLVELGYIDVRL